MKIPYRTRTKWVDLDNLLVNDISIEDIACSLAGQSRFNGITRPLYTVAQHSVLCSLVAPPGYKLAALLHDAHEAYIGDIAGPVQNWIAEHNHSYWDIVEDMKDTIDNEIEDVFGLRPGVFSDAVISDIDNDMLTTEMKYFFGVEKETVLYSNLIESHGVWSTERAEKEFLHQYLILSEEDDDI